MWKTTKTAEHEKFYCMNPNCAAKLVAPNVRAKLNTITGIRHIETSCTHCDHMFEGDFELQGGIWILRGAITRVTDERRVRGFRLAVDRQCDQMMALSA